MSEYLSPQQEVVLAGLLATPMARSEWPTWVQQTGQTAATSKATPAIWFATAPRWSIQLMDTTLTAPAEY